MAHWFREERQGLDLEKWKQLDTLKRRDFVATVSESHAEITKNGSLDVIARGDSRAFICEMAQGKKTSNR